MDALAALRARHRADADPVEVVPGVFVGGVGAARNLAAIRRAGISHVLNASPIVPCFHEGRGGGTFCAATPEAEAEEDTGGEKAAGVGGGAEGAQPQKPACTPTAGPVRAVRGTGDAGTENASADVDAGAGDAWRTSMDPAPDTGEEAAHSPPAATPPSDLPPCVAPSPPASAASPRRRARRRRLRYLCLPLWDDPSSDLLSLLPAALAFIDVALASGGGVLVHCSAGRSRSVAIVAAHLVARRGMSLRGAMEAVREVRPQASPNPGFLAQLAVFEAKVRAGCVGAGASAGCGGAGASQSGRPEALNGTPLSLCCNEDALDRAQQRAAARLRADVQAAASHRRADAQAAVAAAAAAVPGALGDGRPATDRIGCGRAGAWPRAVAEPRVDGGALPSTSDSAGPSVRSFDAVRALGSEPSPASLTSSTPAPARTHGSAAPSPPFAPAPARLSETPSPSFALPPLMASPLASPRPAQRPATPASRGASLSPSPVASPPRGRFAAPLRPDEMAPWASRPRRRAAEDEETFEPLAPAAPAAPAFASIAAPARGPASLEEESAGLEELRRALEVADREAVRSPEARRRAGEIVWVGGWADGRAASPALRPSSALAQRLSTDTQEKA